MQLVEIGAAFGRDHSTVIHSLERVAMMKEDDVCPTCRQTQVALEALRNWATKGRRAGRKSDLCHFPHAIPELSAGCQPVSAGFAQVIQLEVGRGALRSEKCFARKSTCQGKALDLM